MQWSKEEWSAEVWNDKGQDEHAQMTQRQWELLWQGEETFRRCTKELGRTGVEAHLAPQEPFLISKKHHACLPCCATDGRTRLVNNLSAFFYRSTYRA